MNYSNKNARETNLQIGIIQNLNNFQKVITVRILSHILYCLNKLLKDTHNQPDSSFLFYSLKVYGFNRKYLQNTGWTQTLWELK